MQLMVTLACPAMLRMMLLLMVTLACPVMVGMMLVVDGNIGLPCNGGYDAVDGDIGVPCNGGYDAVVNDVGEGTLLPYLLDTVQSLRPTLLSPNV